MSDDQSFARYRLGRRLGKGGMGVVYQAWDTVEEREVALKVGQIPDDRAAAGRLLREIQHARSVRDPHVCAVYATGSTDENAVFLAMELMEGPPLHRMARRARSSPSLWLEALRALALGLAAVHRAGIVHRDVKPQNVMFDARGTLKLLDFGIARSTEDSTVTATGTVIGTAAFMSPEQARGEVIDGRSDLFSAGLTVANLANRGNSRFPGERYSVAQQVFRAAYWPPPLLMEADPAAPPELEDLFSHVLTLTPSERVATAETLVSLIEASPLRHPRGEDWLRDWVVGRVDEATALAFDAARELERAHGLPRDVDSQAARVLAWRRAASLDPSEANRRAFDEEAGRAGFRFTEDWDEPRRKLLEQLEAHPPEPDALRRGAELFRRSGHIEIAVRLLWKYARLRPDDVAVVRQLDRAVFGAQPTPSLTLDRSLQTRNVAVPADETPTKPVAAALTRTAPLSPATNGYTGRRATRAVALPPSPAPAAQAPPWSRAIRPGVTALLAVAVLWFFIFTARTARREFASRDRQVTQVEQEIRVDTRVALIDEAQTALDTKDFPLAIDKATRALGMDLSLESGRRALFIRAQGYIATGQRSPARRDLELYIERTTSFSDPTLTEAKKLLGNLDAADLGRARE
jgi:serine/threonine protein kinase